MKASQIGRYVDQLLEMVINRTTPEGPCGSSLSRLAEEVLSADCRPKRVVTFGGGTGLSTVLGGNSQLDDWPESPFVGLKQEFPLLDVVVCTTDDGGSTGLLLQELPMIGIGDFRKLMLSLALRENLQKTYGFDDASTRQMIRVIHRIFNHRFPKGFTESRLVADPLLVVPRHLRRYCPGPLASLLSSLGGYVSPGGAGPVISPGGHCLGNLLLTAAIFQARKKEAGNRPPDMGAIAKGIGMLSRAIGVTPGRLHPATATPGQLVLRYSNGVAVRGQRKSALTRRLQPVDGVSVEYCGIPRTAGAVCRAIREADLILFAPGSLYTSIMPILQIPALVRAVRENRKALKILGANFWIQEGETDISLRSRDRGFHVSDLVEAYDRNVPGGSKGLFDVVLSANLGHIPGDVLRNYALEGKSPIYLDRSRVESLGVLPVEATVYSRERLNAAGVIHHDPRKFALAVRAVLIAHQRLNLKQKRPPLYPPPARAPGRPRADAPLLCSYHRQVGALLAEKKFFPKGLRDTMHEMIWENRDIRTEHLNFFRGVRVIPASRWTRSQAWDNVLGYYDPDDGLLKLHEQACGDPERIRDNLLTALGESLLGRYLEGRHWTNPEDGVLWGARRYEIRLRPVRDRGCYLDDADLRTYLRLARMLESPHDPDTFGITLNDREGFLPPGLLFGLLYAWYLNNAYGAVMEHEMSLLRLPPRKLIPCQMEERARKQALIRFFRRVVFRHADE
ncbi:MAG: Gluconeogenesis factor [Syntrophaceae bacterium PtaU1.Bin231]|nr:MAG: Gluconeogenesis factor [Syntrophaceae bacterium PtaU1.Bin231]